VKVKTALAQSPGTVATTRYPFDWPTTGSTDRLGSAVRQEVVGSFVVYPVSWPTGAPACGSCPVDHGVRLTVWPFQLPEYRYAPGGCSVVLVDVAGAVLEEVLGGTVVSGTVVEDVPVVAAGDVLVVDAAAVD
jgi:hypothetical protein